MSIGRISGPMLYNNLDRQGVNLSIDGNLIYADVNNRYVGIGTASPTYSLDAPGNVRLSNLYVIGNQISSNTGVVSLGNINNVSITGGSNYNVLYTNGSGTLAFGSLAQVATGGGFTGNNISMGSSIHGSDAYGTNALTTGLTVSDAINVLDNILGNITNSSGNVITTGNLFLTGGQPNYILSTNGAGQTYWANLQILAGLEGFDGNNISLGSNTVGTLGNAIALTTSTTVTDSIALINQLLGNITNSGGNILHVAGNVTAGNVISTLYGNLFGNTTGIHYGNVVGNISGTTGAFTGNLTSANVITTGYISSGQGLESTSSYPGPYADGIVVDYVTGNGRISVGSNDGINFYNSGVGNVLLGSFSAGGNLTVTNNIISGNAYVGNLTVTNLEVDQGNIIAGNVTSTFYGNVFGTISNFTSNVTAGNVLSRFYGNISADFIYPYLSGVTVFYSNSAIKIPTGNTLQRPDGLAGYIRFNTDGGSLEFYTGTGWQPLTNTITKQQIVPDGITRTFTLNQITNSVGVIVSINGTLQSPDVAYTVSTNQITFAEVPLTTDIIDVRFVAAAITTVNVDATIVDTGNVAVGTGNTIIDSFDATLYRSALYSISSTNPYDSQFADVRVLQNNGITVITAHAILNTGSNTVTFYSNISGTTVNLIARGTTAANQLRIQKTYFEV